MHPLHGADLDLRISPCPPAQLNRARGPEWRRAVLPLSLFLHTCPIFMLNSLGLHYSTSPEGLSGVELRVDGFSHKLPVLMTKLLTTAATCEVRHLCLPCALHRPKIVFAQLLLLLLLLMHRACALNHAQALQYYKRWHPLLKHRFAPTASRVCTRRLRAGTATQTCRWARRPATRASTRCRCVKCFLAACYICLLWRCVVAGDVTCPEQSCTSSVIAVKP